MCNKIKYEGVLAITDATLITHINKSAWQLVPLLKPTQLF